MATEDLVRSERPADGPRRFALSGPPVSLATAIGAAERASAAHWRRIVAAVLRFKWIVLLVAVLGTGAGIGATRFVDPMYVARATLWVDVPDWRLRDQGPIQSGQLLGASGWGDLLESRVVLDDVVQQLRLYLSPGSPDDSAALAGFGVKGRVHSGAYRLTVAPTGERFTLANQEGDTLQRGLVGDSVGPNLGFAWVPAAAALGPGRAIEFSVADPGAVAQRLADGVRVQTDLVEGKVDNFMRVELRGAKPASITVIVNAIAERFVAAAGDLKRRKLTELVNILGEQVRHAEGNRAAAERALRSFRVGAVTFLSSDAAPVFTRPTAERDPAFANFFEVKVSREQLRRDRLALERMLAQSPGSGLAVDALESVGSVQHSPAVSQALKELTDRQAALRALRYRYTDEHPPVRRLAEEVAKLERETTPALIRGLVAELAAQEAELGRQVDSIAGGLRQIPPLAIQEARLEHDVAIAEQLFANIQQRYEEARLAEVSSLPEVRILDRAVQPQAPLFNAGPLLVAIAFVGSCGLALVGVVVLDRLDSRVRYPDQVTGAMGLAILGAVPHVKRNGGDDGIAPVIEALRGTRLRVVHAHGAAGPVVVTITSPGKGDGKSFVASNLALAFAGAGYRTLLIDGDIRRGSLHRVLRAARKPGLTDLLAGTAPREQAICATAYQSLWLIGCGTRIQGGPELLSSAPMARLLASLRPSYDVILVDSPPLAAGVDAYALGTMTGALLLVLRTGYSHRELAEAKLHVLDELPIRVLGAVLNDIQPGGQYRYYSYYLAGYELGEDEPHWAGRSVLRAPD